MRRYGFLAVTVMIVVLLAAPAFGQTQRDPFRPVIDPDAGTTTTTDTGTVTAPTEPQAPPVRSETLSNTGSDLVPWVVVALGLVLVGAGSLYAARLYRKPLV
jgi:hypothetical protein